MVLFGWRSVEVEVNRNARKKRRMAFLSISERKGLIRHGSVVNAQTTR
jgi:hypothetical protein